MEEKEITLINSLRGARAISKISARQLADIWNREHSPEEKIISCFCSGIERIRFRNQFLAWYDETYPQ